MDALRRSGERSQRARAWSLLFVLGLVACTRATAPLVAIDPTSPLAAAQQELAQAETARRLGHADEAAAKARSASEQARLDVALAELEDDRDASREAEQRWRRASATAWKLARRTGDRQAQLDAALASPNPRRFRARLRNLPGGLAPAWNTLDETHARLAKRGKGDVPWLDATRTTDAKANLARFLALPRRLQKDPERAAAALQAAISSEATRAVIVERATDLLAVDPWHLQAMVVLAVARDVAAGRVIEDPQLYADAFHGYGVPVLARLLVRWRAADTVSLRLAWISVASQQGLVGDAAAALAQLRVTAADVPLRDALDAVLALGRGEHEHFMKWRRAHDEPSAWLDAHVEAFDTSAYAAEVRNVGRIARRAHAAQPIVPEHVALEVAADPGASARIRRRAEHAISRSLGRLARECAPRGDDRDDCLTQQSGFDLRGSSAIARDDALRAKVLLVRGSAAFYSQWSSWWSAPRELDTSSLATSAWFQRAALDTALAEADGARARRTLASHDRMLPAASHLAVALAREDLDAGVPTIPATSLPDLESFGQYPWHTADEAGPHAQLAAAFAAAAEDRHRDAADVLAVLAEQTDGRAGAWLSALHGLAALRAGDTKTYASALARTDRLAPDSALVHWLRGHAALRVDQPREARRHFVSALNRHGEFTGAFDGLLEATLRSPGTTAAMLRRTIDAAPSRWRTRHGDLVRVARYGRWTDPRQFANVWLLLEREPPEDALALASIDPIIADRVLRDAWQRLATLESAVELDALAEELLAAIPHARSPKDWDTNAAALLFVRDRPKAALAISSRKAPIDPLGMVALLFTARARGEIDDVTARALLRVVWFARSPTDAVEPAIEAWLASADGEVGIPLACHLNLELRRDADAERTCRRARELHPRSTVLTVQWSVAKARAEPGKWGEVAASLFDGPAPPTFGVQPLQPADAAVGVWFKHRALWLGDEDRHADAANAWIEAFALGESPPDEEPDAQIPSRGWTFRAYENDEDDGPTPRSILLAIAEGRIDIARATAAASLTSSSEATPSWRHGLGRAARLAELADADLRAQRLHPAALAGTLALLDASGTYDAAVALRTAHPGSAIAAVLVVEAALREDRLRDAEAAMPALVAEHPRDPLVGVLAAQVAIRLDDPSAARAAMRKVDETGVAGALGDWAELPESIRGHDDELDDVRTPERFVGAMHGKRSGAGSSVARVVAIGAGIEVGQPADWSRTVATDRVTLTSWDASLEVRTVPRAARCNGRACAEPVLTELRRAGATILWTRATRLPAGEATQILAASRDRTLVRWVLPLGARIFELRGEVRHFRRRDAGAALLHAAHSFRPLDAVLSAYDAESLRTNGVPIDEAVRARVRAAFAAAPPATTCPVTKALAGLDDATTAAMLLDLWLATPEATERARLLPCAKPDSPRAARLGLVALLDEAPALAEFGHAVVTAQPDAALADARLLLPQHDSALADPQRLVARELPPRGLLELTLALPIDHARAFVQTLLASDDPQRRAMAWAATDLREDLIDRATALARLGGDATDALRAARFLARPENPDELDSIRAVLDERTAHNHVERALVEGLSILVARGRNAADKRRLGAVAARVLDDASAPDEVTQSRAFLRDIAQSHALFVADKPAPKKNPRVARMLERWRAPSSSAEPKLRTLDDLRAASLAALLPGRNWVFARVGNPALLGTAARSLLRRIQGERVAETQILARMLAAILDGPAARLLEPDHGLDLTRPIECASREFPAEGMICVAFVTDRDRVLSALGQRDHGEDAGVTLPLGLTMPLPVAPMTLSMLPAILHGIVHETTSKPGPRRVAAERARDRISVGPASAHRYLIVHAFEHEIRIDAERYLFVDDRLFVLTSESAQEDLLQATDGPSLADDPDYRTLTRDWGTNTASLTAIAVGTAAPTEAATTAEIVVESDGLRIQIRSQLAKRPAPSRLAGVLPDGAASTIVVGPEVWRPTGTLDEVAATDPDRDRLPPTIALLRARDVAFGWYPRPKESLWQRWVAVLEESPAADRALKSAGYRVGNELARHADLHTIRRGGFVVIATDADLIALTLARIDAAQPTTGAPLVIGTFDGKLAGAAIATLTNASGRMTIESRRIAGMIASAIRHASYRADLDPATGILDLTGRVQLSVAAEETPAVVDGWLAARAGGNSTALPRRLRRAELDGTLAYELEVDDAQWFVDHVMLPSPRTSAKVNGATQVVIEVRPTADKDEPLGRAARERHTAATSSFPSRDPAITKLLASILDDAKTATDRATKINAFVHQRIRYAVTPQQLDGVEILTAAEGDCSEFSTLTVTLLRAAGIPAMLMSGMLASDDTMVAHAWVAFHDGRRWREIDPTAGIMNVTAGHIELSLIDALSLHSLGRLHVKRVTVVPKPAE